MGGGQSKIPRISETSSPTHDECRLHSWQNYKVSGKNRVRRDVQDSRFIFTPATPKTEETSACITSYEDESAAMSVVSSPCPGSQAGLSTQLENALNEGSMWIGWEIEIKNLGFAYVHDMLGIYQDRLLYLIQLRDGRKFILPIKLYSDTTVTSLQDSPRKPATSSSMSQAKLIHKVF